MIVYIAMLLVLNRRALRRRSSSRFPATCWSCAFFFSFFAGLIIASIRITWIGSGVHSPLRPLRGLSGGLGDPDDPASARPDLERLKGRAFVRARVCRIVNFAQYTDRLKASEAVGPPGGVGLCR